MVNSCFGGFPGVHDVSDTALVDRLGGKGRLTGFVYTLLVGAAILAGAISWKFPHIHPWKFADLCGAGVPIDWL